MCAAGKLGLMGPQIGGVTYVVLRRFGCSSACVSNGVSLCSRRLKIPLNIVLFLLLVASARAAGPEVIFEDDFEGGPLKPQWTAACALHKRASRT